ncbi:MAG: YggT family protein [Succinivibrionaceae bacterium]
MPFTLFIFYIPALLFFLRFLLQYTNCDYYHPISKYIVLLTKHTIKLFGNINIGNINISALIISILLSFIGAIYFTIEHTPFILACAISIVLYIWSIFTLLWWILIIAGILSWIPQARNYTMLFNQLMSPIIDPLNKFIPPLGMISLSYLVAFLLLSFINNYAMISVFKFAFDLFKGV